MTPMIKATIATLSVMLSVTPAALGEEANAVSESVAARQVTAKVNGMVCDFCARAVVSVFSKEKAVEGVEVDLDNGEIRIALKAGQTISDARVEDLVTKSGYDLVEIIGPQA
ncbi:MAG: heavy metal-associated domain-containing protein [Pseudomonadota bacterium]